MPPTVRALRAARSLDDLLPLLLDLPTGGDIDAALERETTRLPTFGGPAPRSTDGVWSWDATRLLVGHGDGFEIIRRRVCEEEGCGRACDCDGAGDELCPAHYKQMRLTGSTRPIRVPAAGRIGVRLSAAALEALGDRPAERAREVIEAWAAAASA